jgi:hypothetical protein
LYESRYGRPLSRQLFLRRLFHHVLTAAGLMLLSLLIGMAGYHILEHLSWMDAFLNSAMLLGGMGPVDAPKTDAGKLFAGCYALFAGLVFLVTASVMLAPVVHRLLHKFHWSEKQ